jgi:serine/threonine protein kinase
MKGLKKLHEEKIVHRDLKGSNIFLSVDGIYKLGLLMVVVYYFILIGDYDTTRVINESGNTTQSGTTFTFLILSV